MAEMEVDAIIDVTALPDALLIHIFEFLSIADLGAVRRVDTRLSLVGAVRSKWYGGQGAVQSFVGYTSGLNSAHLMFSNDGNVPNQDGTDLPFFRWQPKLNFDVAL